jgi:hypothetical protein
VSYAPLVRDGQHFVGKPDVAPCRWQIRPIRADRFSAPQRLIKRCLPIGPVLTEEGGGRVGVPRLPRAREALKPGIEPVVIALRRQSARTVAQSGDPVAARDRATVSDVLSATALERLKRVAGRSASLIATQRSRRRAVPMRESEHRPASNLRAAWHAWKAQAGAAASTTREATVAAVVRDTAGLAGSPGASPVRG